MPCTVPLGCQQPYVQVGQLRSITSGQELQAMQQEDPAAGCTVLDMSDWQIIPAENLIAAFQVWPYGNWQFVCKR
jgi:3-dehydroquinate synthase class II